MGYDARVTFEATIREGVTRQAVEAALKPLLDDSEFDLLDRDDPMEEKLAALVDGILIVRADISAGYDFYDHVFLPVVEAVGAIAEDAFEATLENQDTGDAEERYTTVIAGPAHLIPEYKTRMARWSLPVEDIALPLSARGWPLEDIATRECMTIAAFPKGEHHTDAVTRVSVDLLGLDLDQARRNRIARLAVLLAREIAGEDLILHPRPGYGAAERALDAAGEAMRALNHFDAGLNAGMGRPPEGADYEALLQIAKSGIERVRDEAVSRSNAIVAPTAEAEPTIEQANAPRG
ncbi:MULTISPECIES: hypothetical protein [unclassified Variovorax]|uniref:hypothetical protein n=1 Tax=unclassified Variovorax TaxID=663243 RepID=UPI00076CC13A|nr:MULTISPECIES: hypothetical protein [unclassified Variovorax]KWT97726.1 hypothetical protein APY03_1278 [Variovorax sp. WDL1]PNG48825.1 hypothetical protein CHC06_06566 [Variovorax sp. B2]PNG49332.1 hypothetical protein CHC07_06214 [Variovorax sp. B4]VTV18380.1 hypothetical protein WDL1P2_00110 [Variovorax sp. WDL1]